MNLQLIFKTLFIIAVLSLLVIMGMHNPQKVELFMPEINTRLKGAAALMFFGFFAIGFLAGTLVMAGGGKKGKKD